MNKNWRQALTDEELLDREQRTKNQAKVMRLIKDLSNLEDTEIEVDENRVHLLWKGKNSEEVIDIMLNKNGNVLFSTNETPSPLDLSIGSFMGLEFYNMIVKRKKYMINKRKK